MSELNKNFTFTWILKNYSFYDIGNGVSIFSPMFTAENMDETQWRMILFEVCEDSDEYISLQLNRVWTDMSEVADAESEKKVTLDFEIELCDAESEAFYVTEKKKGVQSEIRAKYPFPKVLLKKDLEKKIEDSAKDILILRCRMSMNSESETVGIPLDLTYTIKTTKCLDELSYIREVYYSDDLVTELTFSINRSKPLYVYIEAPKDGIYFTITHENGDTDRSQKIKCAINLINEEGKEIISSYAFFKFSEKFNFWPFPSHLKKSLLSNEPRTLYLKFNFAFANGLMLREHVDESKSQHLSNTSEVFRNVPAPNSLTQDLRKLLFNEELSDMSFCVDGEVIPAHKFILASRSPVFLAMFHQNMVENQTGVINISDMDVQTLKLFLEYLYTEDLPETDWEMLLELLLTADKYQIPSLKGKCIKLLKQLLSPDNVCDVASVADIVCNQTLKDAAMDYIRENVASVLDSPKWPMFIQKNAQLCSEIFKILSEDLKAKHLTNN